jgi:hypothetical protein
MEHYIKNIIPNIKQYGMLLSQKQYFINKTWLLVNESSDLIQYTFKKKGELIISTNGDVIKGKWELLSETKILIETQNASIQLENIFFDKNIIVLLKPSLIEELFILINESVITDPLRYLDELNNKNGTTINQPDSEMTTIIFILFLIITGFLLLSLILPK